MIDKAIISKYDFFSGLNPEELDKVLSLYHEAAYTPNEMIIERADTASNVYLILKGNVVVEVDTLHKGKKELAILEEGDIFGEISFLENKGRSACVTAREEVNTIAMDIQKLNELFEEDNHLGYVMVRNLASTLSERLLDISSKFAGSADWQLRKILK